MIEDQIATAAAERSKAVAQRAHRPSQRRNQSAMTDSKPVARFGACTMQIRDAGDDSEFAHFTGYASTYEQPYEMYDMFGPYTEVVSVGAASDSLNRADLDVPLVLEHQSLRRIARTTNGTLTLSEDDHGLYVDAPQLDRADADVAYIAPKIRSGLIDEMSFMFRITSGLWSPDWSEYRINAFEIHRGDVAIVGYGANPHTSGELRSADPARHLRARLALAINS